MTNIGAIWRIRNQGRTKLRLNSPCLPRIWSLKTWATSVPVVHLVNFVGDVIRKAPPRSLCYHICWLPRICEAAPTEVVRVLEIRSPADRRIGSVPRTVLRIGHVGIEPIKQHPSMRGPQTPGDDRNQPKTWEDGSRTKVTYIDAKSTHGRAVRTVLLCSVRSIMSTTSRI